MFSELKALARPYYAGKTEIEMLQELSKYTEEDIKDAFLASTSKTDKEPSNLNAACQTGDFEGSIDIVQPCDSQVP
jgi:hypothetical protein